MADQDPFADAAFLARLHKLIALLGSEQPGEADAARRKIFDHLRAARLSFTDLSDRLTAPGPKAPTEAAPAREAALRRELAIARQTRIDAEQELARTRARLLELDASARRAAAEADRAGSGKMLAWTVAFLAGLAALASTLLLFNRPPVPTLRPAPEQAQYEGAPRTGAAGEEADKLAPGERAGIVAVQDLAVHFEPSADAGVRAFLNRNTRVGISREIRIGNATWLYIRSASGNGWVRGGDVLH